MQASVKKNKIDEVTSNLYNQDEKPKKANKRKAIERALMFLAIGGTVLAITLFGDLFNRVFDIGPPKSVIYGTWVEQKVAHYATEKFVVSEHGITIDGSVVATSFEFDGSHFSYTSGDQVVRFRMTTRDHSEMVLDSKTAHYTPVFKLEGKSTKALR
ncbi:DUF2850 domain-containing protein [Vibrio makurazakiensis]|uniref:DUF2850 domain-containing protein n=1 Tax=Vibrio makurazakiensis TaxID=2910250 RepID=UPI003D12791D